MAVATIKGIHGTLYLSFFVPNFLHHLHDVHFMIDAMDTFDLECIGHTILIIGHENLLISDAHLTQQHTMRNNIS